MTKFTDSERLEWVRLHPNFSYDNEGRGGRHWIVAYLTDDEAGGISGKFVGYGTDFHSCIDAFLSKKALRI